MHLHWPFPSCRHHGTQTQEAAGAGGDADAYCYRKRRQVLKIIVFAAITPDSPTGLACDSSGPCLQVQAQEVQAGMQEELPSGQSW